MNKEFRYSDLFKLLPQPFKVSKLDFVNDGKTPAYSSDTGNNGLLGFVDREAAFKITEERPVYLVFGDHTRTMNIVHEDFCVMDNVKVMVPMVKMSDEVLLYITTCWKKAIPHLGYARHWSVAKKVSLELPVIESNDINHEYTIDDIDYRYMQERIEELEQERIEELETYLIATGLNDYVLTDTDRQTLSRTTAINQDTIVTNDQSNGPIKFRKLQIGELFEKAKLRHKRPFDKAKDTAEYRTNEFNLPLVNAKIGDNGIMFYGRSQDFDHIEKSIDIIQNGIIATGKVYVQPQQIGVLWDAYLIQAKFEVDEKCRRLFYLAACIEKTIRPIFNRDNKATWDRVRECEIQLPVKNNNNLDFEYMENYIKAIEKIVIADVVRYKDRQILVTKQVLNNQ